MRRTLSKVSSPSAQPILSLPGMVLKRIAIFFSPAGVRRSFAQFMARRQTRSTLSARGTKSLRSPSGPVSATWAALGTEMICPSISGWNTWEVRDMLSMPWGRET